MGYRTHYSVSVHRIVKSEPLVIEMVSAPLAAAIVGEVRRSSKGASFALTEEGCSADEAKWYDHQVDMRRVSRQYPEVILMLEGQGEEPEDNWKKYYLGGRVQEDFVELRFHGFDPNLLDDGVDKPEDDGVEGQSHGQ